ncbi:MAG: LamG domain-containing protein, partial [Candidatus Hydrogenedentes bacterium]|nr:LamG domain-containing protein [Candidatus Hydrogenedentota bacterium]
VPDNATGFVVAVSERLPKMTQAWPFGLDVPRDDGYILQPIRDGKQALVVVTAPTPAGVQNGVYGLLEKLGYGFYFGGDTLPATTLSLEEIVARGLHVSKTPVFAIRGTLPWYNFFDSPTAWELADHKMYIDQLIKMRCNFAGFHTYDSEPYAAYEYNGRLVEGEPLINTSKPTWGTQPMATDKFFAGTGRYFDREYFGAASSFIPDRAQSIQAAKDVLRQAFEYAKTRGMKVCLGFEINGDPLDPDTQKRFEARFKNLLEDFPMLDYVWLWESESLGVSPNVSPNARTLWKSYAARWTDAFAGIKEQERREEGVRLALFGLHARQILKAVRPDIQLVMSGWGGDQWLHCSDFYSGMDKVLPKDIAFSALDNIQLSPTVSKAYGELSPDRQRWPIVWFECDGDQWMPQPNLRAAAGACRDALAKGCQGLLGIHWRTRGVEESATYCAKFAWEPDLTAEGFCQRRASDLFGPDKADLMAPYLIRLQDLGTRWVGGGGQSECGPFSWSADMPAKRTDLESISAGLRAMLSPKTPSAFDWLFDRKRAGKPLSALEDLAAQVDYVLAYDQASLLFLPGGPLERLIESEKPEDLAKCIRESRFAEALHLYARHIRNKGELGILATINTKAWANLVQRANLESAGLEALPESLEKRSTLLVLPDRVIVAGAPEKDLRVTLKTRPLGAKRFESTPLERTGRTTFALAFPKPRKQPTAPIEYGIEVKGKGARLTWPEGFPKCTATANSIPVLPAPVASPERPAEVKPLIPHATAVPERFCVRIEWDACDAETYAVSRDGKPLATVCDGWFEDVAPPSGKSVTYAVAARDIANGHTSTSEVAISVPELPLPAPPEHIDATPRANRVVLGWESNAPNAARYRVLKCDARNKVIQEIYIDADYGHYLQMSDQVDPGHAYAYTIAAVAPDGRSGAPSKKVAVEASREPLKPVLDLKFDGDQFLKGLTKLAESALVLGGKGWAQLPPQPEWNPSYSLTLALWVKMDRLDGMPVLLCKGAWQQSGYFLQVLNRQIRFYLAGVDTLDAGTLPVGKWTHLVATYGFGEMRIYLNGEMIGRKHVQGRPRASDVPLLIGRYGANDDAYFVHGTMDDIRIYDVPLTETEISTLYRETKRK